ncbi:MAG TPA: phosphoglycerate dehydrogenase [Anaerolineales bacterium]
MPTVLMTAPYMIPFIDRFEPVFARHGLDLIVANVRERMEEPELLAYAGQFDGAVCGDDRFTARVLEACVPRLKVISKWGTGIDSIDSDACDRLGVRLFRTPNAFTVPVADTVIGYMLSFARRLPWMDASIKRGEWEKVLGSTLSEMTLGVIGVGNIGKAVTRRARAFGMTVLGNDIIEIDPAFIQETGIEMMDLPSLLNRADFVSVNCTLNLTSRHLINAQTLSQMKPSAVVINTARGPIVDEAALVAALEAGRLAGAALDVFEIEPLPLESALLKMDNVLLAPHNANSSPLAWENVHKNTLRNLIEGLSIEFQGM